MQPITVVPASLTFRFSLIIFLLPPPTSLTTGFSAVHECLLAVSMKFKQYKCDGAYSFAFLWIHLDTRIRGYNSIVLIIVIA